jgi:DUF2971 family protein
MSSEELPDRLCHYTNAGGLTGILEKQQLWATHVGYLNDSQEFLFGAALIAAELDKINDRTPELKLENIRPPRNLQELMGILPKLWPSVTGRGLKENIRKMSDTLREKGGPYVACLSAAVDQLSQWRGYGTGGGYAIVFDAATLKTHLDAHTPAVQLTAEETGIFGVPIQERKLVQVDYDADKYIPQIGNTLQEYIAAFSGFVQENVFRDPQPERPDEELQALLGPKLNWLFQLASRLKHSGFEEEAEHRIVTFCPPEFFTPNEIGLIPRVSIDFAPSHIVEVMVGPGQHMDTRESSVRSFLHVHHKDRYEHVKVTRSETPFTGM